MKKREWIRLGVTVAMLLIAIMFFVFAALAENINKTCTYLVVGSILPFTVVFVYHCLCMVLPKE